MQRPPLVVVIDGPAGAGKSTAARALAAALGLPLLDTGAIYRSLAWAAAQRGVSWEDEAALAELARALRVRFSASAAGAPQQVWCDDVDVTRKIRTPHISDGAARVSRHPEVRAALLGLQRGAAAGGCVAEGRDLGTVVFPDASVKIFLTASPEARARRRLFDAAVPEASGVKPRPSPQADGREASTAVSGAAASVPDAATAVPDAASAREATALADVAAQLKLRDERDSTRAVAPLRQAADAVLLDSSDLDEAGVLARLLALVEAAAAQG